jgi:pantoate--beta-alanine ligase
VAVFGAKDAQQLALIRRMTADLNLGVEIEEAPIVREADGLAASSRNTYLSAAQRATALALPRALQAGARAVTAGPDAVRAAARAVLDEAAAADPPLVLDYLALVDPGTMAEVAPDASGPARLLAAARAGPARLIDNKTVMLGRAEPVTGARAPSSRRQPPGRDGQRESHAADD